MLMPGHSHSYVDQDCFSPISCKKKMKYLKTADDFWLVWIPKYLQKNSASTDLAVKRFPIQAVYDWKTYLDPHIRNLRGITNFRSFQFHKDDSGKAVFYTKPSMLSDKWTGCYEGFGYQLLDTYPDVGSYPNVIESTHLIATPFQSTSGNSSADVSKASAHPPKKWHIYYLGCK